MLRVTCVRRRSSAELERVRDASHDRLCALLLLLVVQQEAKAHNVAVEANNASIAWTRRSPGPLSPFRTPFTAR
jgi:hypothetical protein